MASRRKLKQTIKFVSSELITDLYFRCLLTKSLDENKADELVLSIVKTSKDFVLRANRPTGKDNPKLVKEYFKSLYADWQVAMEKIIKDMEAL